MRFVTASVTVVFCASYRRAITDNLFPKKVSNPLRRFLKYLDISTLYFQF